MPFCRAEARGAATARFSSQPTSAARWPIPAAGGIAVPLPADGFNAERNGRCSSRTAVTTYFARPQQHGIFVATLDSSDARLLLSDYVSVDYAPGYLLGLAGSKSTRAGTLMAHPFDPERLELIAEPSPVAERIEYVDGIARGAFSVSENGTLVYANMKMPTTRLTWFDRSGKSIGNVGGSVPTHVRSHLTAKWWWPNASIPKHGRAICG